MGVIAAKIGLLLIASGFFGFCATVVVLGALAGVWKWVTGDDPFENAGFYADSPQGWPFSRRFNLVDLVVLAVSGLIFLWLLNRYPPIPN
jgi:hypothetical protein